MATLRHQVWIDAPVAKVLCSSSRSERIRAPGWGSAAEGRTWRFSSSATRGGTRAANTGGHA